MHKYVSRSLDWGGAIKGLEGHVDILASKDSALREIPQENL